MGNRVYELGGDDDIKEEEENKLRELYTKINHQNVKKILKNLKKSVKGYWHGVQGKSSRSFPAQK